MAAAGSAQESALDEPQRDDQNGAEGGGRRRTEQRWRGQRVAQQALKRGAGEAERAADHEPQQGARQADFEDDDARRLVALAKQHVAQGPERQNDGPDRQ